MTEGNPSEKRSPDWHAGWKAACHQAAHLMGHFLEDEAVDTEVAESAFDQIKALTPNWEVIDFIEGKQ